MLAVGLTWVLLINYKLTDDELSYRDYERKFVSEGCWYSTFLINLDNDRFDRFQFRLVISDNDLQLQKSSIPQDKGKS